MQYRGIRYTVRARIERNEWTVSIHPAGIEGAKKSSLAPVIERSWHRYQFRQLPKVLGGGCEEDLIAGTTRSS